ncbi:conserved hypothetical protein [Histoplasma capsulatum var. duboisii H88]|uniref:Uncharacterized protein n=1 Tax=Ajellomyces capsulatus (strain H88) TaxID=544711 RepID=F0UU97_AJEC8|nr:conserved hypothetical protein [Histoplasma capsulatum var. duboisii H88]QSS57693.1 hypothetical protein I7I53_11961 [Histoplasma capsulatum var. duboisii H88]
MAALGQTIAVFDKSGKMVSTSKHLFGVFKEARLAYRERKAEINAGKAIKNAELEARRAMANYHNHDSRSVASSRRYPGRSKSVARHSELDRHPSRRYPHGIEQDTDTIYSHPDHMPKRELSRRHTSNAVAAQPQYLHPSNRSRSAPNVDMDLAYGEYHPASLERVTSNPEDMMSSLVAKAKGLLIEAECAQHSAHATMAHLQKNPDAMAAVALTLAEISNLASKLAPSALAALKSSSPAIFALLSSPQFMIAAGVGIGVTVVMFGGYKIVKRIQAANSTQPEGSTDELIELNQDVSRVESWRRGVADFEAESVATSVDGEFITPRAAAVSGIFPTDHSNHHRLRSEYGGGGRRSVRGAESVRDTASHYTHTTRSSRRSRRTGAPPTESGDRDKKAKKKEKTKKHSPLRLLFKPK